MTAPVLYKAVSVLAGVTGLIVAQVPTETDIGAWSKLGFSGACLAVALILATRTIPAILATHKETNQSIRDGIDEGFSELKASIDHGNDQVATLLQSTLVKLLEEKRSK